MAPDNARDRSVEAVLGGRSALSPLQALGAWCYRRAENVLAAMLAIMFVAFIIQIVFRYLINLPIGWTQEITVIMWIWLVLWGAAFVIREAEEVRFDVIYGAAGPQARRVMCVITAAALVGLYGISLPAVVDYVAFMKVESSAYLKVRFDLLFSIYVVFAVAVIVRYVWLCWRAVWGTAPEAFDPTKAGSGV
jgi:TRAP-type C4-dicarboxylate transport system permease small subunit